MYEKKVKCKKCQCKLFSYVPVFGANDVKFLCHHSQKKQMQSEGNQSKFTCNCGEGYDKHRTEIYTKDEE